MCYNSYSFSCLIDFSGACTQNNVSRFGILSFLLILVTIAIKFWISFWCTQTNLNVLSVLAKKTFTNNASYREYQLLLYPNIVQLVYLVEFHLMVGGILLTCTISTLWWLYVRLFVCVLVRGDIMWWKTCFSSNKSVEYIYNNNWVTHFA